jgi:RAB6A-GEF complex partner protein 2
MMGYIRIAGSFVLDGALVNQAPFEEVKRKGVVGGQGGGGVVGVETNKRNTGLFGGFGWGNIGESIGGLLGNGEMSSIKEMRGIANSKAIPIISTPQSVLFVDLRLNPGESKSYKYSFTLPKGLPPTHRGKVVKISYKLIIGTQRAASGKGQQHMRQIEIPFRVLGGVDSKSTL